MPITQSNNIILYTEADALSKSTGVFAEDQFAIRDKNNPLKQIQFAITPGNNTAATLTVAASITGDATLTLPASGTVVSITSTGDTAVGGGLLLTTAVAGFLYVDTCSGTPTGVPTGSTGRVPLVFDTSTDKLYIYNGSWKSTTVA